MQTFLSFSFFSNGGLVYREIRVFILCFDPNFQQRTAVDFSEEHTRRQVQRQGLFYPKRILLVSSFDLL